ncbi:hypothetical protein CYPRO_2413 [Cyclonatronum proteinivorum]|uniref:Polysaccharide (De)acetylase n=1 Tax=Cyclonatronum proteinivorum TaxID=1457365 RepID=A0A345UMF3_9BACT|nr:hypothetical protein CYPRO_2413 [Cyclonatronum proteinivorum]
MFSFNSIRSALARHDVNRKGWKTDRKIIVIESDDWGAIRMPNASVYQQLLNLGYAVDKCPYARNDALASEEDLQKLFNVLLTFKDVNGNSPVITANCVTANPDFNRIKENDYQEYYWEPITETFKRYDAHAKCFELWKSGINKHIFFPQFHGREHVNWKYWLAELQNPESDYRKIYAFATWTLKATDAAKGSINLQAALDTHNYADLEHQKTYLQEGMQGFQELFGFTSESYIATNFIIHSDLLQKLSELRVKYIQGMKYQKHPILDKSEREMVRHYTGEKNKSGQTFLVRNCVFEPSQMPQNFDSVGECLKDIKNAFFWKKPAIITAHRLNFVGYINRENRDRNLKMFSELLSQISKKWPDVEFMTSPQLGKLIEESLS